MPGGLTSMGALRMVDVKEWRKKVVEALKRSNGNRRIAADALGVSWRTLMRWLEEDDALRAKAPGGRTA
ncbi:MAG: hypothetical protein PVSMB8_00270 [Vulcanimicrobiaceae bacterium]